MDLSSFRKVVENLENGLSIVSDDAWFCAQSVAVQNTLRAGVIKQFCLAYDVSGKMIQRWAKLEFANNSKVGISNFQQMLHLAKENRLIASIEAWLDYRHLRMVIVKTHRINTDPQAQVGAANLVRDAGVLIDRLDAWKVHKGSEKLPSTFRKRKAPMNPPRL